MKRGLPFGQHSESCHPEFKDRMLMHLHCLIVPCTFEPADAGTPAIAKDILGHEVGVSTDSATETALPASSTAGTSFLPPSTKQQRSESKSMMYLPRILKNSRKCTTIFWKYLPPLNSMPQIPATASENPECSLPPIALPSGHCEERSDVAIHLFVRHVKTRPPAMHFNITGGMKELHV